MQRQAEDYGFILQDLARLEKLSGEIGKKIKLFLKPEQKLPVGINATLKEPYAAAASKNATEAQQMSDDMHAILTEILNTLSATQEIIMLDTAQQGILQRLRAIQCDTDRLFKQLDEAPPEKESKFYSNEHTDKGTAILLEALYNLNKDLKYINATIESRKSGNINGIFNSDRPKNDNEGLTPALVEQIRQTTFFFRSTLSRAANSSMDYKQGVIHAAIGEVISSAQTLCQQLDMPPAVNASGLNIPPRKRN